VLVDEVVGAARSKPVGGAASLGDAEETSPRSMEVLGRGASTACGKADGELGAVVTSAQDAIRAAAALRATHNTAGVQRSSFIANSPLAAAVPDPQRYCESYRESVNETM